MGLAKNTFANMSVTITDDDRTKILILSDIASEKAGKEKIDRTTDLLRFCASPCSPLSLIGTYAVRRGNSLRNSVRCAKMKIYYILKRYLRLLYNIFIFVAC